MKIFLDTEFSGFLHPRVWSIGLVTMDGRECYVELDPDSDAGRERMAQTPWDVQENVLDKLQLMPDSGCESEFAMGRRVGEWLLGVAESGRVELLYDYSLDLELLTGVLDEAGFWPAVQVSAGALNVARETSAIGPELASEACYQALRRATPPLYRHHALGDAYALRDAWRTWRLVEQRPPEFARLLSIAGEAREGWLYGWLATPALALGGRTPLDALDQNRGVQAVVDALVAATDGRRT